jgi:hypothetical protein
MWEFLELPWQDIRLLSVDEAKARGVLKGKL